MESVSGKLPKDDRRTSRPLAVVLVAFLLSAPVSGLAVEPKHPVFGKASSTVSSAAIPLSEVALRASEVLTRIQGAAGASASDAETESIRRSVPRFRTEIDNQYRQTMLTLRGYSTLSGLQSLQQQWQQKQARAAAWLKTLTARARVLDESLRVVKEQQLVWATTLEAGRTPDAPPAIFQQIQQTLEVIGSARAPLEMQRAAVLNLQSSLARDIAVCGNMLDEISRAQQSVVKGTFQPDSLPIWSAWQWVLALAALPAYSRDFAITIMDEVEQYWSDSSGLALSAVMFAAVLALLFYARLRIRQWEDSDEVRTFASELFEHPFCASLTLTLLALTSPFSQVPPLCKTFLQAVSIAPMILLVRSTVEARVIPWLCALGILFAVDTVRQAFAGVMPVGQAVLIFESLVAMAVIGVMMTRKGMSWFPVGKFHQLRGELARLIAPLLLVLFTISLLAAVTGYMNLARLLTPSILVGGYLGLALYVTVRILSGLTVISFHLWPLRCLRMVQNRREFLERRFYLLLVWGAVFAWVFRFLDYGGLLKPSASRLRDIFGAKFERGTIAISLGDVLAFAVTLCLAYLLSSFIRFILREEIYLRLKVATGLSYAASSLLHYFILALGFLVGIGLMGFNLTRVTVLAGALGVGIGFGLQGVVNNFVSGLILLFERPVSAGDNIEFGGLVGEVRRIGMRSSTVRTYDGADIIVPNSMLVSEKVTNWTLSDQKRRISLPVGVNYGADPDEVMHLLEELARSHADILGTPPPECLFLGYGDSSINFELRAWTDKFNAWTRVKSDLVVAVYHAVQEAGMSFPYPQRDIHVVSEMRPVPADEALCPNGGKWCQSQVL